MLFFLGAARNDTRVKPPSTVLSISAPAPDWINVTLWEPPYRKLEILALASGQSWSSEGGVPRETFVRPAWGMFVAVVVAFLLLWTNTENYGVTVIHILDSHLH